MAKTLRLTWHDKSTTILNCLAWDYFPQLQIVLLQFLEGDAEHADGVIAVEVVH